MTNCIMVHCSCHNELLALQIANILVTKNLAACVNIISNTTSVFKWESAILTEPEYLLIIKTVSTKFIELEKEIRAYHTYKVPEIIAVPISHGSVEYLNWLHTSITNK